MTLEDRARALQLALAQGSWNDGVVLIAAALRKERQEAAPLWIDILKSRS